MGSEPGRMRAQLEAPPRLAKVRGHDTRRQVLMHPEPIPVGLCQCGCGAKTEVAETNATREGWVKGEPLRTLKGHGWRTRGPDYEVDENGCWIWLRYTRTDGYGQHSLDGIRRVAHRVYYERFKGPIPEGLVLDHLCRVHNCVNPDHLEAVTVGENVRRGIGPAARHARKTHCPKGHPYDEDNTIHEANGLNGARRCRTCRKREWKKRQKEKT